MTQTEEVQCSIECHDQFYCENNFCKPRCDKFEEYSHSYTVAIDVLIIASTSIGMMTGLASLVISCLRYKHMYVTDYHYYFDFVCKKVLYSPSRLLAILLTFFRLTFPTILVFYFTIPIIFFGKVGTVTLSITTTLLFASSFKTSLITLLIHKKCTNDYF